MSACAYERRFAGFGGSPPSTSGDQVTRFGGLSAGSGERSGASRRGSILRPMRLTPRRPKRAAPATATPLDEDGKPTVEGSISLVRNAMRLKPNVSEKSEGKRGAKTGRGGGQRTDARALSGSRARRRLHETESHPRSAQDARGCSWVLVLSQ